MTDNETDEGVDDTDLATDDDLATPDDLPAIAFHVSEPEPSAARILAGGGLALAALAGLELLLTIALGLAIQVEQLSRVSRIGYAFLTQLEKSPLGLLIVGAAIATAIAAKLATPGGATERRAGLAAGLVLGFAVVLAIGSVLAIVARFDVADVMPSQPIDGVTRRVLAIFALRNIGAAAIAFVAASLAVRTRGNVARERV